LTHNLGLRLIYECAANGRDFTVSTMKLSTMNNKW